MSSANPSPVTFDKHDVEIIARETLYSGFFSLNLYRFRHRLFNGEMSGEVTREIFERGHAAVLLPYDPVRDEVVLVEQLRIIPPLGPPFGVVGTKVSSSLYAAAFVYCVKSGSIVIGSVAAKYAASNLTAFETKNFPSISSGA